MLKIFLSSSLFKQFIVARLTRVLTAAARAALPIPNSVCNICVHADSGMAACVGDFNVHTDVDAGSCTQPRRGCRDGVRESAQMAQPQCVA